MSTNGAQTKFDFSEFDTEVTESDEDRVIETIAGCIERLRDQIADDILEEMFRSEPGSSRYGLISPATTSILNP